jgi:cytochrome c-type biogenesis protein CcsB
MTLEIILMWAAVAAYAAGSVLFAVGLVFARPSAMRTALIVSVLGLLPHAAAVTLRWVRVGHGPYLGFYEVVSILALACVALLGVLVWRYRTLAVLGVVIMPVSFLMIGGAMLAPKSDLPMPPTLVSFWLVVHIAFAMLSYGAFLVSFALAVVYLARSRSAEGRWTALLDKLPSQARVDDLSFKFVAVGFIFLAIMIVAGAIWANEAWGRYWGWDPIETWSLISWLVYALYLHLRLTLGWRGERSAIVAMVALPILVFALIGVPVFYKSIHGAYLTGTTR